MIFPPTNPPKSSLSPYPPNFMFFSSLLNKNKTIKKKKRKQEIDTLQTNSQEQKTHKAKMFKQSKMS